jgi:hypothetical protein
MAENNSRDNKDKDVDVDHRKEHPDQKTAEREEEKTQQQQDKKELRADDSSDALDMEIYQVELELHNEELRQSQKDLEFPEMIKTRDHRRPD